MATVAYYNDLEADVPVVGNWDGGPITFDRQRSYIGAVGVHVYDISRSDGLPWTYTTTSFQLLDGNGTTMLSKNITKWWGQDPGWIWLNGGLGSWYDLRWRIGILDQRDSSNALIYGWSTIKFDVKYQY